MAIGACKFYSFFWEVDASVANDTEARVTAEAFAAISAGGAPLVKGS